MIRYRVCRKFWQESWLGIDFSTLKTKPNYNQLANADFYNDFYKTLFITYRGYSDLPKYWLAEKQQTAIITSKYLNTNSEILSYGSGIGYIEKYLLEIRSDLKISVFDFSNIASKWLIYDCPGIRLITDINKLSIYESITMLQLFSALPTNECIKLLKSVRDKLKPGGTILITHHPAYEFKLTITKHMIENIKNLVNLIRPTIYLIKTFKNRKKLQFWGWQRNSNEIEYIINNSNLRIVEKFYAANQEFFIVKAA